MHRDTAGGGPGMPLGFLGTSLYRLRTDLGGEGGSSRAFESGARAARLASWGWRQLRHARGGPAAGGGWGRKRKRRWEREVGPSRRRSLGDGKCGPRPTAARWARRMQVPGFPSWCRPASSSPWPPQAPSPDAPGPRPLTPDPPLFPRGAVTIDPDLSFPRCWSPSLRGL